MVLVVKDRIKDTSSTSGSGTITLDNSPPAGYQAFSTLGNGSTTYYAIQGSDDSFEIGLGTYNANTLTRTTILSSSNNGVIINLPSGSHTVWVDYPAAKAYLSEEGIDKSFTATAGIAAGRPVILNSAGTVTQVAEIGQNVTEGFATENRYNGTNAVNWYAPNLATIGTNKVATCYSDGGNSNYAVGQVAEVSANGDLSFGTKVVLNSATSQRNVVGYNSSNSTIAFGYTNASNNAWYSKAGTISGTTLSLGSEGTIETSISISQWSAMVDADTGHFVIFHTGGGKVYATAVTINGTNTPSKAYGANITGGGASDWYNNVGNLGMGMDYDTNLNRYLLTSGYATGTPYFWIVANSGSAFTITEKTIAVTNWKGTSNVVFDPDNNKMILSYKNTSNQFSMAQLTMASADFTIDHYIHTSIACAGAQYTSYETDSNKIVALISGGGSASSYATFTNNSTAFTQVSTGTWNTLTYFAQKMGIVKKSLTSLTDNPIPIIGYANLNDSDYTGYAISFLVGQTASTNLTASNYLGVASTSAGANASVNINIPGSINNDQTGLTIGKNYYTSGAGVISTTLSPNFVGRAISSTQLLLEEKKGNSLDGFSNGSITKGKPVVMQADGDVAQVVETSNSESFSEQQGSEITLTTATTSDDFNSAHNSNGTFLIIYNASNRINARLGTYSSNGSITWGTNIILTKPVSGLQQTACYYDSYNDCFVAIGGTSSNQYGYATILTYSGVTLTEGNFVEFDGNGVNANGIAELSAAYDSVNKIGYAAVGQYGDSITTLTVSGTSITAGTRQYVDGSYGSDLQYIFLNYDSQNNRGIIYFRNEGNNYYASAVAFTSSAGTLTFGTKVVLDSSGAANRGGCANSPTQTYAAYRIGDYLYYNYITFSGASITAATKQTYTYAASMNNNKASQDFLYNIDGKFYFIFSRSGSPKWLALAQGTVSGTTLNNNNIEIYNNLSNTYEHWIVGNTSLSNPTMILAGKDTGNNYTEALTYRPAATITVTTENLTATNYLGIASNTVANNENATIQTQGAVNPDQSSLTAGQLYYVQTDGTLSTTAGSPSVIAGIATSATTLLVTKS